MCAAPAEDIISEHFKNKIVIIRRECGDNYSHTFNCAQALSKGSCRYPCGKIWDQERRERLWKAAAQAGCGR